MTTPAYPDYRSLAAEAVDLIGRLTWGLHDSHLPEIREHYRTMLAQLHHPDAVRCTEAGPKWCPVHGSCKCDPGWEGECRLHVSPSPTTTEETPPQ